MLWLKRNLFTVVGGVIALGLLGFGGYYLYTNWQKNNDLDHDLEANMNTLTNLYQLVPFPHATNVTAAKKEVESVKKAITDARKYFTPIPAQTVKNAIDFKTLLDNSLFELTKKAEQTGVGLPEKNYAFSFRAEKDAVQFPPATLQALPEQLEEVKIMCGVLFEAKINRLVNIKRVHVGDDGSPGRSVAFNSNFNPGGQGGNNDVLDMKVEADPVLGTTIMPYQVTFESFSGEIANVLEGFQKLPYGMLIKAVMTESEPPVSANPNATPGQFNPNPPPGQPPRPGMAPPPRPMPPGAPGRTNVVPRAAFPRPPGTGGPGGTGAPGSRENATVLNEKLIKVTLLIESIKLPASK